jgi:hypothetical protein
MPVPVVFWPTQVSCAEYWIVVSWPGTNETSPFAGGAVIVILGAATCSQRVPKPAKMKTRAGRPGTTGVERVAASTAGAGTSPGSGAAPPCELSPEHPVRPASASTGASASRATASRRAGAETVCFSRLVEFYSM